MRGYRLLIAALALLAYAVQTGTARAGIVTMTGATQWIAEPADWHPGILESSQWVRVFMVESGVATQPIVVDRPLPGSYPGLGNGATFHSNGQVTYPVGTEYEVYLIHFDPVGTTQASASGSMTFDRPIAFISDWYSSDPNADTPIYQGLEGGDLVTLSQDLRTLDYQLIAGAGVDQFYLATANVPEPASVLVGLPIAVLLWLHIRRRR